MFWDYTTDTKDFPKILTTKNTLDGQSRGSRISDEQLVADQVREDTRLRLLIEDLKLKRPINQKSSCPKSPYFSA